MITASFFSNKNIFLYCIEELKTQIDQNFGKYDFLIFSIHPSYNIDDITDTIKKFFNTSNFVAFHSNNSFIDNIIKEGGVEYILLDLREKEI